MTLRIALDPVNRKTAEQITFAKLRETSSADR